MKVAGAKTNTNGGSSGWLQLAKCLMTVAVFISSLAVVSGRLCPGQCQCDNEKLTTTCAGSNLTVIPIFLNPTTRILEVQDNKVRKLENALDVYPELELLDLSKNEFKHLKKRQFFHQAELQLLNLSNNFLTTVHSETFKGPVALQTLDLSHNILSTLEENAFKGLDSLVELRLHHNRLEEINPATFNGLGRLRILHLEFNRLKRLSGGWMAPLGNLRFIYATNNILSEIPDDCFKSLAALRVITLNENQLSNIGQNAFRGCRSVDTLDLSYNLLDSVPSLPLSQIPQLDSLDLSGNPIRNIDSASFKTLYELQKLRLTHMPELESIAGHAFLDNMKLQELELDSNPNLNPLPWGLFAANTLIKTLSVRNNSWSTLSPQQIPTQSIETLLLAGLPLNCNCSVTWLWELYQRGENSSLSLDTARCYSVPTSSQQYGADGMTRLGGEAGDPLAVMASDQLQCKAVASHIVLVISISVLVTVCLLVLVSLCIYKIRRWRLDRKYGTYGGAACMHIKDDTMVYKGTLHPQGKTVASKEMFCNIKKKNLTFCCSFTREGKLLCFT